MFAIAKFFVLTAVTSCNISVRKSCGFYRLLYRKVSVLLQVVHNTTVNARLRLQQPPVTIADRNDNFTHCRCQPSCSLELSYQYFQMTQSVARSLCRLMCVRVSLTIWLTRPESRTCLSWTITPEISKFLLRPHRCRTWAVFPLLLSLPAVKVASSHEGSRSHLTRPSIQPKGLTIVTYRQTDRPRYIGNNRLHLYVRSTAMRPQQKFADFRRNRSTQTSSWFWPG